MLITLTIFHYFIAAVVDAMDKVLISKNRIKPLQYTFYTVVTGAVIALAWPWVYQAVPVRTVLLNLASGAYFALALYVFFKALEHGEVSRVVPFVFGLVPVFDLIIGWALGRNAFTLVEWSALWLLIPGAMLVSYRKRFLGRHILVKLLAAFLFSSYYVLWQYSASVGPVLNSLMWNRIGSAGAVLLLLLVPVARNHIFAHHHIENKKQTSFLFLAKQAIGGVNFIFLSWLMVVGKIALVNSLQGFRYVFLLGIALLLTHKFRHILEEEMDKHMINVKIAGLVLIALGTILLFLL
jgi:uncharacterized membrane protein